MLKYILFSKKLKKIFLVVLFSTSLVILVNLNKENLYELAEQLEFFYRSKFSTQTCNSNTKFETNRTKIKLFCIILTSAQSLKSKARAVSQTWARECDDHRFIAIPENTTVQRSDVLIDDLKLLKPENLVIDKYEMLTNKVYLTLIDVYKNFGDYDFYLKADDDTYVFMNHLSKYLSTQKNTKRMYYYGHKFYSMSSYNSGGAGYVLSNNILRLLVNKLEQNYSYCPNTGIEDTDIGACLRKINIFPKHSVDANAKILFHPFNVAFYFKNCYFFFQRPCVSEGTVSFHYLTYQEIYKIHYLWSHLRAIQSKKRLNMLLFNIDNHFISQISKFESLNLNFVDFNSMIKKLL